LFVQPGHWLHRLACLPKGNGWRWMAALLLLLFSGVTPAAAQTPPLVVEPAVKAAVVGEGTMIINEILTNPVLKEEPLELIELYNRSSATVDLSQWTLTGAVDFYFSPGTKVAPGGYVVIAQHPAMLQARLGANALGPWLGRLNNEGDTITLRNHQADVIDEVTYGLGFPWPITGEAPERSIQLLNPHLDNTHPSHWRSAGPTPGAANATLTANPPPLISAVSHAPTAPTTEDVVRVTATVSDTDGVAGVQLLYQIVAPGSYIRIWEAAYEQNWTPLAMTPVGGNVYSVDLPPETRRHRHLIRYRISASDGTGQSVRVPYGDDPQPNFAYFVYDGAPPWRGAIDPTGEEGDNRTRTYDFNAMRPLPIYHLLANHLDVADAQFIPPSPLDDGYMGDDYFWWGTLVYNGQVYDHIQYRARGGVHRYAVGKNKWKFNFHPSHRFQAYDDYGQPYPQLWDKLNFSAVIQHANRGYRGEQGLFESVGHRLFQLAGVPASATNFVHFRVIDGHEEQPGQYDGDFWGLYLAIEELDGPFLDARDLPDGNLYKMEDGTGELNNQGLGAPTDKRDLNAFMEAYKAGQPDPAWWRANFDLATYYSFRSILEAIHHYDVNEGKNYFYFQDPNTGRWSIYPWDIDLTWATTMTGDGNEPFRDRVLPIPEFQIEYQNRLRELRDLLFNPDQMFPLLEEYAVMINTPADGLAMVDADRTMWDFNPILINDDYTVERRAGHGVYYVYAPGHDFAGMVQLMKDWVFYRTDWIDRKLLTDPLVPVTPTLTYVGPAGFPADQLTFESSPFQDPAATFAAIQWRVAEVSWPGLPGDSPEARNRYEMEATWQSEPLTTFTARQTLPPGSCRIGQVCRVRVRMKNSLGRWSHWSPPIQFTAGAPAQPPMTGLKVTEIMYHPGQSGFVPENEFEFIELQNTGATPLNLSNLRFSGGIAYQFPVGTLLQPGAFLVLAENKEWFAHLYGYEPFGQYDQKLSNSGDQLLLADAFGRPLLELNYADESPWPVTADGLGYSLVLNNPELGLNPNLGAHWRASYLVGGSPGVEDPLPVVINEVLAYPAAGQSAAVELYNPTAYDLPLGAWTLVDTAAQRYRLPNITLPAGGYWTTTLQQLSGDSDFALNPNGGDLRLEAPTLATVRRYAHIFRYGVAPAGVSAGRYVNGANQERFPLQSAVTLGAENAAPAVGPVVISEVLYNAGSALEFIELTNPTDEPVLLYDPQAPANTWRLTGVLFQFPSGVTIPPQGKLVITASEPAAVCTAYTVEPNVRVLGPLPLPLDDSSQHLRLQRPLTVTATGGVPYTVVDEVTYTTVSPWPGPGEVGVSLERLRLDGYGDEPLHWRRGVRENDVIQAAGQQPTIDLCSFDAYRTPDEGLVVQWATRSEQSVNGYHLWRSADDQRTNAQLVTTVPITAQGGITLMTSYRWVDATATPDAAYTYWLTLLGPNDQQVDAAFTSVRILPYVLHLPVVSR
jgi:hypothetical protein